MIGEEMQGKADVGDHSGMLGVHATVERLCRLGDVSRSGYYRRGKERVSVDKDVDLRDAIQRLSLAHKYYGYRRITAQLRHEGWVVNAKHVLRLMGEDNLLCLRKKAFVPPTTDSHHRLTIFPNLIARLVPSAIDQIWQADITYVRLGQAFVYLAVVLDSFSRKVVGWALEDHLEASLAIAALDMALTTRNPIPGSLIHHSDRGIQYACQDYKKRLTTHDIAISMSRAGNPYDNAKVESFMKTLKAEEVNAKAYTTLEHARSDIGSFLETFYNSTRLHSSLGYQSPNAFEAKIKPYKTKKP